ncbi:hypothetical protein ACFTWH_17295 [Streptomyces sp. NPDC057011]|uniref:hypothetical protein n=1 Tax=unclassified Streptomyces TaxID=2593676 RepID=UPI00362DEE56
MRRRREAGYAALPFDALWDRPGIGSPAAGAAEPPAGGWQLAWDSVGAAAATDLVERLVARDYDFHAPGSARTLPGARLRADAEQLARLIGPYEPQAIVSFAAPQGVHGAAATVLLPAVTRLPVWFWPAFDCPRPPPQVEARRIAVVTVPRAFRTLARHPRWLAAFEHVTFLHGSGELPPEAVRLCDGRRTALVEVLGDTESGAAAHRTGWDPDGPWTLPDGRQFLRPDRRAHPAGAPGLAARLRALLPGADVTCVRATDPLHGETYDVLVAGGGPLTEDGVRALARGLGAAPREVRLVGRTA